MAEFKKCAVLIIHTLLILTLGMSLSSAAWAEATKIKRIRTGSEKAYVRVVIETDARIEPRPKILANENTLQIFIAGAEKHISDLEPEAYRDDVVNLDVTRTSTETRIKAILAFNPIRVRTFHLIAPHRFVIDAYRPSSKAAGNLSADMQGPIPIIEEIGTEPNEISHKSASARAKKSSVSTESVGTPTFASSDRDGSFQQRLLLFLIVVTSILLVVIIFLMCVDKRQK